MRKVMGVMVVGIALLLSGAEAVEPAGTIRVSGPAGLQVRLDGAPVGTLSSDGGGLDLLGLTPGRHLVTVERAGEPPVRRAVQVSDGKTAALDYRSGCDRDATPPATGAATCRPFLAAVPHCAYPDLPAPAEPAEVLRARLEAAGQWAPRRTPPANPQVGDTWMWYIWNLAGPPTATLKPCTVRGMGPNCYVVVDDAEWNVSVDQADVDRIVTYFEYQSLGTFPDQGIWQLDTGNFGDPPNPLDGLSRVFLLYYHFGIASDGFFWVYDQFPDGSQPYHSNEADVVYLASDSGAPASDYMLGVAAHEFQHMIHYNYDTDESTWANEGLSELAMWLFGHPDTISSFNGNPDNSLTTWGSAWADYIQTYLWTLYVYEQYGGQPTIWDVVHTPGNGMAGYLTAVTGQGYGVTMENVFGEWSVANYLDDPAVPDGQYGYAGETLPAFVPFRTHSAYPASGAGTVQSWATDYVRLTGLPGAPSLAFNGVDSGSFRVFMVARDPARPTLVRQVSLTSANDGSLELTAAEGYAEVVVSIASVGALASSSYSYAVTIPSFLFANGFETGTTSAWSLTAP
jgi:hypothetical protein